MRHLFAGALVAIMAAACSSTPHAFDMPKPTEDQTYGISEVECSELQNGVLVKTGMCCWQGSVCGGGFPNIGCPEGKCCQVDDAIGASLDGGAPAKVVRVVGLQHRRIAK